MPETTPTPLRALSVHQPWADLIARGHKTIETRGYARKHRGPLLICATQSYDKLAQLITSKYQHRGPHPDSFWDRPLFDPNYQPRLGVALATCQLVDCRPMVAADRKRAGFFRSWSIEDKFSWVLEDVRPILPIPIVGRQGLFDPTNQGVTGPLTLDTIEYLQPTLFEEAA